MGSEGSDPVSAGPFLAARAGSVRDHLAATAAGAPSATTAPTGRTPKPRDLLSVHFVPRLSHLNAVGGLVNKCCATYLFLQTRRY